MFYYICKVLVSIFLFLTGGIDVHGKDKIPRKGPYIIVANHQSLIDPMVLMACLPVRIFFLAAAYLFRIPVVGQIIALTGAMPIKSQKGDFKSLKRCRRLLENGKIIGIFPEGGVSKSGKIKPFMPGWSYLALKSKVPVLPVFIHKTRDVLPVGSYIPRRCRIEVYIGDIISLSRNEIIKKEQLAEATRLLNLEFEKMSKMVKNSDKSKLNNEIRD